MADFIESFLKDYGGEVSEQLSSNLNIDQNTALRLLPLVTPLILGGLKRQAEVHGGKNKRARSDRVNHILNKYGSPSVLDHIGNEFQTRAGVRKPDPRLGGLLGDSGIEAANTMSKQFGLDKKTAMKLIVMLAPIILGALSKQKSKKGMGSQGISALIDQDGDDQIFDDVAGFLMSQFTQSKSQKQGGLLEGLLGSIVQRRCRNCGYEVTSEMDYCPKCGKRL
jgi:hypothetical protein